MDYWKDWEELGQKWLKGEILITEWNGKKLNPKQIEYVNCKDRYVLASGGMRSGKTFAFMVKLILLALFFPHNKILLGRQTRSNLERTTLRDFFEICPKGIYDYKVKEGLIVFGNGSEIVTMGLESAASGSDTEGAEQRIKGLNLGAAFIDQLEETEQSIFEHLTSRMSNTNAGIQQIYMTTNPANFWALDYFKINPRPNTKLFEMSMVDNKANLPEGYLEDQLQRGELYVKRFVYGDWSIDNLSDKTVFKEEFIRDQSLLMKTQIRETNGVLFYEEPNPEHQYQIGVDTSEASVDPCAIVVINKNTGNLAARYSAFVNVEKQVEMAIELGYRFNKALIVPEVAGTSGGAFISELKKKYPNIYTRKTYDKREDKEIEKLGFHTNYQTKTMLIEHFKKLIEAFYPKIFDRKILDEFKVFTYSDEAKKKGAGAQSGFHDDLIMATLLAYWDVPPVKYESTPSMEWDSYGLYQTRYN